MDKSIAINMNLNASSFAKGIKTATSSVENMTESMKDATSSASKMTSVMQGIGSGVAKVGKGLAIAGTAAATAVTAACGPRMQIYAAIRLIRPRSWPPQKMPLPWVQTP